MWARNPGGRLRGVTIQIDEWMMEDGALQSPIDTAAYHVEDSPKTPFLCYTSPSTCIYPPYTPSLTPPSPPPPAAPQPSPQNAISSLRSRPPSPNADACV